MTAKGPHRLNSEPFPAVRPRLAGSARTAPAPRHSNSPSSPDRSCCCSWPWLEVAIVYFANFALDNAVAQGARLVRTGQAQTQKFDAAAFKTEVCKYISAPISCSGLKLDVSHFASFGGVQLTNPLDASGNLKSSFNYDPGVGSDIVVVRAFYEWTLTAKLPQAISLSNMNNGDRLLVATAAFRNEPFPAP